MQAICYIRDKTVSYVYSLLYYANILYLKFSDKANRKYLNLCDKRFYIIDLK